MSNSVNFKTPSPPAIKTPSPNPPAQPNTKFPHIPVALTATQNLASSEKPKAARLISPPRVSKLKARKLESAATTAFTSLAKKKKQNSASSSSSSASTETGQPPPLMCFSNRAEEISYFLLFIGGKLFTKVKCDMEELGGRDIHLNLPPQVMSTGLACRSALETIISETLQKKYDPLLIKALYHFLIGMEEKLKENNLSRFLLVNFQLRLAKEKTIVAFPPKTSPGLIKELPSQYSYIPLAEELVANDYSKFENLIIEEVLKKEKNPLALAAVKKEIIAGKAVIFCDSLAIASYNLKTVIFAPRALLIDAEKEASSQISARAHLMFSLIYGYVEEGKRLSPVPSSSSSEVTASEMQDFQVYDEYYGTKLSAALPPLFRFRESVEAESMLNDLKEYTRQAVARMLQLYHGYFQNGHTGLKTHYGESSTQVYQHTLTTDLESEESFFHASLQDLTCLFKDYASHPQLFFRLVNFLEQGMTGKMCPSRKKYYLNAGIPLPVFDILGCNAVAIFAKRSSKIAEVHRKTILENVRTHHDLYFMMLLLSEEHFEELFGEEVADVDHYPNLTAFLKFVCRYYLRNCLDCSKVDIFNHTLTQMTPQTLLCTEPHLAQCIDELKGFFEAMQSNDISKMTESHLQKQFSAIPAKKVKAPPLGPIAECANPQISYRYLLKVLLKHSVDEIESFKDGAGFENSILEMRKKVDPTYEQPNLINRVTFGIDVTKNEGDTGVIVIEVTNLIGFHKTEDLVKCFTDPQSALVTLYPFVTTVKVETRLNQNPEIKHEMRIVPRHTKEGGVEEISYQLSTTHNKEMTDDFGTTIALYLREAGATPLNEARLKVNSMRSYISNVLAMSQNFLPCTLRCDDVNGNIVTIDSRSATEGDIFACTFDGDEKAAFVQIEGEGWVFRNGYPYMPLAAFLKEQNLIATDLVYKFSQGWALNIPVDAQNKSRVSRADMQSFVASWLHHLSSTPNYSRLFDAYFPHFKSTVSTFYDVYPGIPDRELNNSQLVEALTDKSEENLLAFFSQYKVHDKHFLYWIDQIYKRVLPKIQAKYKKTVQQIDSLVGPDAYKVCQQLKEDFEKAYTTLFKEWGESIREGLHPEEIPFIDNRILPWFATKLESLYGTLPNIADVTETPAVASTASSSSSSRPTSAKRTYSLNEPTQKAVISFIQSSLQSYALLYADLSKVKRIEGIEFYFQPNSILGGYSSSENKIILNLNHFSISDILALLSAIAKKEHFRHLRAASLLLPIGKDSGLLNHELEHARRGVLPDGMAPHGDGFDASNTKLMDFEMCAVHYASIAHSKGLFNQFSINIRNFMKKYGITFELLKQFIDYIGAYEPTLARQIKEGLIKVLPK